MSSGTYPIVGLHGGIGPNGARPIRYEINKFANPLYNPYAKDQLNLFLLSLERIQRMSREERLSWFQLAGIHGEPYVDWDNSKGSVKPDDKQWLGYCTHASILFPTWHRVYVALVEQAVHECMKQVVSEFSAAEQARLKPAMDHWRYPYWDWALAAPATAASQRRIIVPELMRSPRVPVVRPNGLQDIIDNPMYRYAFPLNSDRKIDGISDVIEDENQRVPFSQAPYTVRHPLMFNEEEPFEAQVTWSQGISDNNAVEQSVNNGEGTRPGGQQLVTEVYHLFSMMRSYPPFSNTRWTGSGKIEEYRSLEGVHNNVHVFIGGMTYGHMSENEVAAFDPAFWMHHGNVERLLSIFQALNPQDHKNWPNDPWISKTVEPWFTGLSQDDAGGTWTRPYGKPETTTSPLTPFHKDDRGTVYDSDGCRYISQFGYAFEELQDWLPKYHTTGRFDEPLFCQDVRRALIDKYGWALPSLDAVRRIAHGAPQRQLPKADPHSLPASERQYNEYVINVRVDRFANDGQTFVVNFFLGEVPSAVRSWEAAEKLGVVSVFGGSQFKRGKCSNCASQAENEETRLVTGQFSITSSLVDVIVANKEIGGETLRSLDKTEVGEYLRKHLHWRVSTLGHHELDIHDIPSLKVSVAIATATLPTADDEFVRYGEFEVLNAPTSGRLSGFDPTADRF